MAEDNRVKVTFNIDKDLKQEFEAMCESIGITMNTAISLMITHAVRTGEFDLRIPVKSYYRYATVSLEEGGSQG